MEIIYITQHSFQFISFFYFSSDLDRIQPTCEAKSLSGKGFDIFTFTLTNQTAHIGGIKDLFRLGEKYRTGLMNKTTVSDEINF